jgi:hypothetical protein
MKSDADIEVRERYQLVARHVDERARRLFAAAEARALGEGGVVVVHAATGLSERIIRKGMAELDEDPLPPGRVRRAGGGRKRVTETDPTLWEDLEKLVAPTTRGDPMSPLRWTLKGARELTNALKAQGHEVSHPTVIELLKAHGYRMKVTKKTLEGEDHADRNAQFEHIQAEVERFQTQEQPVISIDTKKKELIGDFKNGGAEWQPSGYVEEVNVHDFPDDALAKAIPYGVYDLARNEGHVSVGIDHDTAEFAVSSILRWWHDMGKAAYPDATDLLITADAGGSNGYRLRMWKIQLQRLANETGLTISVCHLPPGTSKWNKIEHRLFCHITRNWRGHPLTSLEVVVNLIGNVRTTTGLCVQAVLDEGEYATGIKITDEELAQVNLERDRFHGEWNYMVLPK